MLTKEKIIQTINDLPDDFSIDELFDRIILLEKIEKANEQSINGEIFTKQKLGKWLQ